MYFVPGRAWIGTEIHSRIGFRYWKHPGPFVQYDDIPGATGRFVGWWSVVSQAAFSFIGTEIVAVSLAGVAVSLGGTKSLGVFSRLPPVKPRILVVAYQRLFEEFTSVFFCKGQITSAHTILIIEVASISLVSPSSVFWSRLTLKGSTLLKGPLPNPLSSLP